jgi:hypothetical protein
MINLILIVQCIATIIAFLMLTDLFQQIKYKLNFNNLPIFGISLLLLIIAIKLSIINLVAYLCLGFIFSLIFVLVLTLSPNPTSYKISVALITFLFWMHVIIVMGYTIYLLPPKEDDASI